MIVPFCLNVSLNALYKRKEVCMYLIGSRALELHNIGYKAHDNSDYDLISEHPIKGFEHHKIELLNNTNVSQYVEREVEVKGVKVGLVSLKGLALIKRSHLHREIKFQKHIDEYNYYLKKHSYELSDADKEFLETRIRLTKQEFGDKHPSLNKTVEDFFNDSVEKKYEHDYLHELYAYRHAPIYTMMQEDKTLAKCDKHLWDALDYQAKLQAVAEEAYVIATERYLVPTGYTADLKQSYVNAINRICTTLTSGWFRNFAIDNYTLIVGMFSTFRFNQVKNILGE